MINMFLQKIAEWAKQEENILCVLLVGSYARGTSREDSDIDLCIVSMQKKNMLENPEFIELFGEISRWQTEEYGKCTSIRVWYHNGMEVEFGIVDPSWLDYPLDKGTKKVLEDGFKIIVDKKGLLCGDRI